MQQRRKEFIQEANRKAFQKQNEQSGYGLLLNDPNTSKPMQSMFTFPVNTKKRRHMTQKEKDNKKVPNALKSWIYRPEIAAQFSQGPSHVKKL